MEIGNRIKSLRLQHNLTQEELANRCELSKGFISMLENDLTSPSVSTLQDILEVFGLSMHEFFSKKEEVEVVHYANDYFTKEFDNSKIEFLISDAQARKLEPLKFTLKPQAMSEEINPHEAEMFGYVIEGKVDLVLGNKTYKLSTGDSFYYSMPEYTQKIINRSKSREAVVVWLSSPPIF